jgi:hypothetical protein
MLDAIFFSRMSCENVRDTLIDLSCYIESGYELKLVRIRSLQRGSETSRLEGFEMFIPSRISQRRRR